MSRPAGRPPKPTELHVLAGNPGKRKVRQSPPAVLPDGVPELPAALGDAGREAWVRLWTNGRAWIGLTDYGLIRRICKLEDYAARLERLIDDEGLTHVTESSGRSATHYLLDRLLGVYARIESMEHSAALTPTDRARVGTDDKPSDPTEEFLRGRRGA